MVQIAFLLWALFFIILGFSMMPGYMTLVMVISFIGGLIDASNKKEKEKREREREKGRGALPRARICMIILIRFIDYLKYHP